ncbi:MAG: FG-GAP-like repeat-containing protein [Polyangiales bacterium]
MRREALPVRRLALLASLSLSLLVGCPDSSPGADAATPLVDALDDGQPDAPDDLATYDVPRDRALLDRALDTLDDLASPDALDASSDLADASTDGAGTIDAQDAPRDTGDAGCEPGLSLPCTCVNGVAGTRVCHTSRVMGFCTCVTPSGDGGMTAPPPRLLRPLSGTRVTSQRPTLRWELPAGLTRARVELCGDRACTRRITQQEVSGSSWRPPATLSPGVVFWHVLGLAADGSVAWTSATWEFQVRHRDTPVDSFYGPLRDFNGDGFDDLVAGTGYEVWQLHVYLGAPRGLQETAASILRSPDAPYFSGDIAVGDVNGDGRADFGVGEGYFGDPLSSPSDGGVPNGIGHVHVFTGDFDGLAVLRNQVVDLRSEDGRPEDSHFGQHVALVDFNGDGFDDLIASRGTSDRNQPQVFLFLGSSAGIMNSPASTLRSTALDIVANVAMCGVGDIDGDGYGDVAVGVSHSEHGAVLLHGNSGAQLESRLEEVTAEGRFLYFGQQIAAGDVNGDRFTDVFVGSRGQVSVVHGTSEGMEMAPAITTPPLGVPESGGEFGGFLGVQGDLNGDGYLDLVAEGACDLEHQFADLSFRLCVDGVTYLYASSSAGVSSMWARHLISTTEEEGGLRHPISPGDLNGDGIDDLAVGVPAFSTGA